MEMKFYEEFSKIIESVIVDEMTVNRKVIWVNTARKNTLAARLEFSDSRDPQHFFTGISEADIDPIQQWCEKHDCGVRTSFDMFKFRNKKEITMFLLHWG